MSTLGHPYAYMITLINIPRYYTLTYREGRKRERDWLLFLFQSGSLLRLRTLAFWKAGVSPTVRLAISTTQVCVGVKGEKKLHTQTLCEAGCTAFLFLLLSNSEGFENLFHFFF